MISISMPPARRIDLFAIMEMRQLTRDKYIYICSNAKINLVEIMYMHGTRELCIAVSIGARAF